MTLAIFPFSREPRRSAAPAILAASIVSARTAASAGSPSFTALAALRTKSRGCKLPDEKANVTPPF